LAAKSSARVHSLVLDSDHEIGEQAVCNKKSCWLRWLREATVDFGGVRAVLHVMLLVFLLPAVR
jgi:hypothetical protein